MDYNRLALTPSEIAEAARNKSYFPFRDWHVTKVIGDETRHFDSKRRAMAYLRKLNPAPDTYALYKVA